jgi:hypothetical protein
LRTMHLSKVCASSPVVQLGGGGAVGVEPTVVAVGAGGVTSIRYRIRAGVVVVSFAERPALVIPFHHVWHMAGLSRGGVADAEPGA